MPCCEFSLRLVLLGLLTLAALERSLFFPRQKLQNILQAPGTVQRALPPLVV